MKNTFLACLILLATWSISFGKFRSPWIAAPGVVNLYDMEALKNDPAFAGKSNDALFKAVHDTFANGKFRFYNDQNHAYHFHYGDNNPYEPISGVSAWAEYYGVFDPIKYLNVYGYGYCGFASALLEGLAACFGYEGRRWGIDNPGHSVAEVYYNGGWHYFDLDLFGWGADASGSVYSLDWIAQNPGAYMALPSNQRSNPFFSQDQGIATSLNYNRTNSTWYSFHDCQQLGHDMSFSLRQGESMVRYWDIRNQQNMLSASGMLWQVPQPNGVPAWAEGSMVYQPDLAASSSDYPDGVYESSGISQNSSGITSASGGYAVFAVRVPYIISRFFLTETHTGAVAFQISKDLGATWASIAAGEVALAKTQYDFLIKCTLQAGAVLNALKFESIFMWNPGTYPKLQAGTAGNAMKLYKYDDTEELTYYGTPAFGQTLQFNAPAGGELTAISVQARLQRMAVPPDLRERVQLKVGNSEAGMAVVLLNEQDTLNTFATIEHGGQTMNLVKYPLPGGSSSACVQINKISGTINLMNVTVRCYYKIMNGQPWLPPLTVTHAYTNTSNQEIQASATINPADFSGSGYASYTINTTSLSANSWVKMEVASNAVPAEIENAMAAAAGIGMIVAPNPFNPETKISVNGLPRAKNARAVIKIFSIQGNLVHESTVTEHELAAGVVWKASNLASGLYIVRCTAGNHTIAKQVILMR